MRMILDGKEIADSLMESLKTEIQAIKGRPPSLSVILVGENPASAVYVSRKKAAAKKIGIEAKILRFDASVKESALLNEIDKLNQDPLVDGIIVQMPLPQHIDADKVLSKVAADKDVDGFGQINQGKLLSGALDGFVPATPLGIQTLLLKSGVNPQGKHVVIVGRSRIVGRPLFALLSRKAEGGDATVTLAHSRTKNLPEMCRSADILIAAIGVPKMINGAYVKPGAVVIDVGINREGTSLVGDVDFESVQPIASLITPVPGGVGPMTIASLLQNTVKARMTHV